VGELTGTVALVTGAAQGIGRCIAEFLARDGASVMLADIQSAAVAAVARELVQAGSTAAAVDVDIAEPASAGRMIERTLDRFGTIDVLVNNAGIDAPPGHAWELPEDHWRQIIDVDLSGAWWCTRAVIPHMIERRRGRIVFISSTSARRASSRVSVAYNAAKAGLVGLTIALSLQLEPHGIRVNAIAPGPTGTGEPMTDEERAAYLVEHPLGLGGPEPVAHACLYLARPSGNWISGAVLNVSGGRWRG
jgi:NAD(P)-dependent dehydrogenase (short-subunit alcohol dehydrogenase family)